MLRRKIKFRPFYIWWLGIILFGTSLLVWIAFLLVLSVKGMVKFSFDLYCIRHIYLPFIAALVGFIIPVICLRVLKRSPARVWVCIFVIYLLVMLTWGIVDIRYENYQLGCHGKPNGQLIYGHKYYFHGYLTWYFLPYRGIEKGIDG